MAGVFDNILGTISSTFGIGLGGPELRNDSGALSVDISGAERFQFDSDGTFNFGASLAGRLVPVASNVTNIRGSTAAGYTLHLGQRATDADVSPLEIDLIGGGFVADSTANNRNGSNLHLVGGAGTGNNTARGLVRVKVPTAGASGATVQTTDFHTDFEMDGSTKQYIVPGSSSYIRQIAVGGNIFNVTGSSSGAYEIHLGTRGEALTIPTGIRSVFAASGWRTASTNINQNGQDTVIEGGPGTGSNTVRGEVAIGVAVAGASGTSVQSTTEIARFTRDEEFLLGSGGSSIFTPYANNITGIRGSTTTTYNLRLGPLGTGTTQAATTGDIRVGGWIASSTSNNQSGSDFHIVAGPGTGDSILRGDILFETPNAGASGTSVQGTTTKMTLFREGELSLLEGGTVTSPVLRIRNDSDSGFYSPVNNQFALSLSGARAVSVTGQSTSDLFYFARPGAGATDPKTANLICSGYESASLASNETGPLFFFTGSRGTGDAASGGFAWYTYTPVASGTTAHSSSVETMVLSSTGNLSLKRSTDIQLYVGLAENKPASLAGAMLILDGITTAPTGGVSGAGGLYVEGNNLKFIDSTGAITTIV